MTREEFNALPDWKTGPQTEGVLYKYDKRCSCARVRKNGRVSIEMINELKQIERAE